MLLSYYGPDLYDRYTREYDPTGLGVYEPTGLGGGQDTTSQLTDWTEDDVIRAYLVSQQEAQERLYHQQVANMMQQKSQPNYSYSYDQLQGYRSMGGSHIMVSSPCSTIIHTCNKIQLLLRVDRIGGT